MCAMLPYTRVHTHTHTYAGVNSECVRVHVCEHISVVSEGACSSCVALVNTWLRSQHAPGAQQAERAEALLWLDTQLRMHHVYHACV